MKKFVHRYRWGHDDLRKKYRRLLREGKVVLIEQTHNGWLYKHTRKVQ